MPRRVSSRLLAAVIVLVAGAGSQCGEREGQDHRGDVLVRPVVLADARRQGARLFRRREHRSRHRPHRRRRQVARRGRGRRRAFQHRGAGLRLPGARQGQRRDDDRAGDRAVHRQHHDVGCLGEEEQSHQGELLRGQAEGAEGHDHRRVLGRRRRGPAGALPRQAGEARSGPRHDHLGARLRRGHAGGAVARPHRRLRGAAAGRRGGDPQIRRAADDHHRRRRGEGARRLRLYRRDRARVLAAEEPGPRGALPARAAARPRGGARSGDHREGARGGAGEVLRRVRRRRSSTRSGPPPSRPIRRPSS